MRIAGALLFAAALAAPLSPANGAQVDDQVAQPPGGFPTQCWVDVPKGGAMVIPGADTLEACEAAAQACLGDQTHAVVHHSNLPLLIQSDSLTACDASGE